MVRTGGPTLISTGIRRNSAYRAPDAERIGSPAGPSHPYERIHSTQRPSPGAAGSPDPGESAPDRYQVLFSQVSLNSVCPRGTVAPMTTRALGFASVLLLAVAVYGLFFIASPDRVQGDAARIVYFHVPMAWVAFLAFFVVFGASIAYLRSGNARWDRLGRASAEVGVVFTTLVLITGSIWGATIWGTWWSWDPKLTTTLILWFMYLAYLMVRSYAEAPRGPRYAAIVGIVAFFDVPIVYLSSYWWRTLHPQAVIGPLADQQPSSSIVWVLLLSLVAFTVLYAFLVRVRVEIEQTDAALSAARGDFAHAGT